MRVYVDGSLTAIAIVSDYCQIIEEVSSNTTNEAEYLAVIRALGLFPDDDFEICSDSQLVVRQLNGEYRILEPRLQKLVFEVRKLTLNRAIKMTWVPREENLAGILLDKEPKRKMVER